MRVEPRAVGHPWRALRHGFLVVAGAMASTLALFMVLPLMQAMTSVPAGDLVVRALDSGDLPPPPPPPEPEPEKEKDPEPDEKPPELTEDATPLDLADLELALNAGFGDDAGGADRMRADLASKLVAASSDGSDVEALFSVADLDQKPRPIYQPDPVLSQKIRDRAPGTVSIVFVVDERGRVETPIVQKSSDPIFEAAALGAVKQWKFEPGKRKGKPVRFRMRVPITFRKGG